MKNPNKISKHVNNLWMKTWTFLRFVNNLWKQQPFLKFWRVKSCEKIEQNHSEQTFETWTLFENPIFYLFTNTKTRPFFENFKSVNIFLDRDGSHEYLSHLALIYKNPSVYIRRIVVENEGHGAGVKELRLALIKWNCCNRAWRKN